MDIEGDVDVKETVDYFTSTFQPDTKRVDYVQCTKLLLWYSRCRGEQQNVDGTTGLQQQLPLSVLSNVLAMAARKPCDCRRPRFGELSTICPLEEVKDRNEQAKSNAKVWNLSSVKTECERQSIMRATSVTHLDFRYALSGNNGFGGLQNNPTATLGLLNSLPFKPSISSIYLPIVESDMKIHGSPILDVLRMTPNVSAINLGMSPLVVSYDDDNRTTVPNFLRELVSIPHIRALTCVLDHRRSSTDNSLWKDASSSSIREGSPSIAPLEKINFELVGNTNMFDCLFDPVYFTPFVKNSLRSLHLDLTAGDGVSPINVLQLKDLLSTQFPLVDDLVLRFKQATNLWFSQGILGLGSKAETNTTAMKCLSSSAVLPRLRQLSFGFNTGYSGMTAVLTVHELSLLSSPLMSCNLIKLDISRCGLGDVQMLSFVKGIDPQQQSLPVLEELDLSYNSFTSSAVLLLTKCEKFFSARVADDFAALKHIHFRGLSFQETGNGWDLLLKAYRSSKNLRSVSAFPSAAPPEMLLQFNRENVKRA